MNLRPLGRTPHLVSPVGLGLAAVGRPGYITLGHAEDLGGSYRVEAMERHAHTLLDAAWAHGIRYFDAARSYGRAEAFLGGWLGASGHPAVVGSKWGYTYTAGWRAQAETHEVKEHSRTNLDAQWRESRALLKEQLNLYQIHSATLGTGVLHDESVLARLFELQAGGTSVGVTLSGPEQARTLDVALRAEWEGKRLFDTVQATWNPLEPSAAGALALAHSEGVGVILKEVLANGRLTRRNDDPSFGPSWRTLTQHAERLQTTAEALAFAAALARPWADIVLSGAATEAQLQDNLSALSVAWDDEAERALAGLAEPSAAYWQTRSSLPWS